MAKDTTAPLAKVEPTKDLKERCLGFIRNGETGVLMGFGFGNRRAGRNPETHPPTYQRIFTAVSAKKTFTGHPRAGQQPPSSAATPRLPI
jgi:hypothetical protein